jgi:hypothetical protein
MNGERHIGIKRSSAIFFSEKGKRNFIDNISPL